MINGALSRRSFLWLLGSAACLAAAAASGLQRMCAAAAGRELSLLQKGWFMQSSERVRQSGEELSSPGASTEGWYAVSVPSTVLAGLVANGEYTDLYFADKLKSVPVERFKSPWWYRCEFVSPLETGRQTWLNFRGINYRANIFLNGKKIADAKSIVGTYREFELNVTDVLSAGKGSNVLVLQVFPPVVESDLAITFVDWAPVPPDLNMGVWQDVEVRTSGPVAVRHAHVISDLELPSCSKAGLTVMADLINATDREVKGRLDGEIEGLKFSQEVTLAAKQTKTVTFLPENFAQLKIANPRVWWPWQLGNPEMYELKLSFSVDGILSDSSLTRIGIRKVSSRLIESKKADEDKSPRRLFTVNGVDLLVLGAGYAPDLLQRRVMKDRPDWQEDHVRYLRDMNLNSVRLEGKLEDDAFYDLCDRYGILVLAGWCCCSPWERWDKWKEEQHQVAYDSLYCQIRRARTHPSMLVWLNGSDFCPPGAVESKYLDIEKELYWPCPTISSATGKKSEASEETGVKMKGPYKWEPPVYWLADKHAGGAWGFNTEVGPGAVPPPLESLQKMLPKEHYWPIDDLWKFHCGLGAFSDISDFTGALDARYGKAGSIADFSWKAQAQAYETVRAMFEAFRRNAFKATGEIQWMLNNAWPSMIWHLYDYYFRAGGAYFATKVACEPLHVLYSYDNRSLVVVNNSLKAVPQLKVTAAVYDIDSKCRYTHAVVCNAAANAPTVAFSLPELKDISTTHFLRLTLTDSAGKVISVNSYWLSTVPDLMKANEGEDSWNITHVASFADFKGLESLPPVQLALPDFRVEDHGIEKEARLVVENKSNTIAFLVRLKLSRASDGEEILPIRFEDNYFMLLPGEKRLIAARYLAADSGAGKPVASVDCYNNGRK
jgi:exo-1,4-beta-D-glucosaminidase